MINYLGKNLAFLEKKIDKLYKMENLLIRVFTVAILAQAISPVYRHRNIEIMTLLDLARRIIPWICCVSAEEQNLENYTDRLEKEVEERRKAFYARLNQPGEQVRSPPVPHQVPPTPPPKMPPLHPGQVPRTPPPDGPPPQAPSALPRQVALTPPPKAPAEQPMALQTQQEVTNYLLRTASATLEISDHVVDQDELEDIIKRLIHDGIASRLFCKEALDAVKLPSSRCEPPQREPPQREPPQREPPQREPLRREPPQREPLRREPPHRDQFHPPDQFNSRYVPAKKQSAPKQSAVCVCDLGEGLRGFASSAKYNLTVEVTDAWTVVSDGNVTLKVKTDLGWDGSISVSLVDGRPEMISWHQVELLGEVVKLGVAARQSKDGNHYVTFRSGKTNTIMVAIERGPIRAGCFRSVKILTPSEQHSNPSSARGSKDVFDGETETLFLK